MRQRKMFRIDPLTRCFLIGLLTKEEFETVHKDNSALEELRRRYVKKALKCIGVP